jgi:hypothetical protein
MKRTNPTIVETGSTTHPIRTTSLPKNKYHNEHDVAYSE